MATCAIPDCENEVIWSGKGRKPKYCSDACKQEAFRNRKESIRNKRLREQRSKLYVVPCSLDTANAFVSLHHRHHKPVPGSKINLAVIDEQGLLRGVAIIGRPVARMLDDGLTLEVNRVAVDGCPNACSALYGAARKAVFAQGYHCLITYTLQEESGASMRGAGWHRVKETEGSKGWLSRPGRVINAVQTQNKWRWETVNPEFRKNRPIRIILPEAMLKQAQAQLQPELFNVERA